MPKKPYERQPDGMRLGFHGMNLVLPPDKMPDGKFPYAQNVRAYLHDAVTSRVLQDSSFATLPYAVHTLRRLNDSTPAGAAGGFVIVGGASTNLYKNGVQVDSGYSGNPLSLIPFRPNASVQPWMYVGDSKKMSKVNSQGTVYKMGIMEPQQAPTVTAVPASNNVSLVGPVTITYWGDSPHSGPVSAYIWKNINDSGWGPVRMNTPPAGVSVGNSTLLDDGGSGNQSIPMQWVTYTTNQGTVNTNGTDVQWVSGAQFGNLAPGNGITIGAVVFTIQSVNSNIDLTLTTSAGVQNSANYSAVVQSGTQPLFSTPLEPEGFQDFNFIMEGTLFIPTPGTYIFQMFTFNDSMFGIGSTATGQATWSDNQVGKGLSLAGQTKTAKNGYPLVPLFRVSGGGGSWVNDSDITVTFSAAGNYPFEIDYDYWYHSGRSCTLFVTGVPGGQIVPIPSTVITNAQYRYTYRSSQTGAVSNPSPPSAESPISALSNSVSPSPSFDAQVDKIDWYRMDAGISEFTYVGTTPSSLINTTTLNAVTQTGITYAVSVANPTGIQIGMQLGIDVGANQEAVTVTALYGIVVNQHFYLQGFYAVFTKTHLVGVNVNSLAPALNDSLLDADIVANPLLQYDNFEPFPSLDLPRKGTVQVTGGIVNWISGDQFNTRWLGGTDIIIGTVAYTLVARPGSPVQLTANVTQIIGGVAQVVLPPDGSYTYEISEPILAAQPLPYIWGPTDNINFAFGCGDPLRPGTLYWCKGNNLDSAPDTNQQDITSPSEPLINGAMAAGLGVVMSSERGWLIYPNFFNALATVEGTVGSTWTLQEANFTRGLYIPRCIAIDGIGNIFFRAKDGIYMSAAGAAEKSITDADLYNLFPHEGMNSLLPITRGPYTLYPPDDTQPQAQKFAVATGYLYYDYIDTQGNNCTLVFDIKALAWVFDVYQHPAFCHALEEGPSINTVLCGCVDGSIRPMKDSGTGGTEVATGVLLMPCFNAGDTRAEKHWGDLYIEAGTRATF